MDVSVHVEVDSARVFAGTLFTHRRRGAESVTFAYSSAYLGQPGSYTLDPELPLGSSPRQSRARSALFGAFGDSAPDRWGRTLVKRQEEAAAREEGRASRSLGEVDYLLAVRDDMRQGALRFRLGRGEGVGPFLADDAGIPTFTDLPELIELTARAEATTASLSDLQRLVHVGSSLGGARPKAHVRNSKGRLAMVKFPSAAHDTWNVMAWESVALELARNAGVVVPDSTLLRLAGRGVLVVDRFDRRADGTRVGYVSAMTMLEASDGDQRSYLEIAEVIENRSDRATAELEQLWRRIALSVLISNTDDHLRNHGFLHRHDDTWRLSPAFDINPNPEPGARHLSTAIDRGEDRATVAAVLGVASLFRLRSERARQVLIEVAVAVSRWRVAATRAGLSENEINQMAPAFDALATVPA